MASAADPGSEAMIPRWTAALGAVLVPVIVIASFLAPSPTPPAAPASAEFSFEADLQGWSAAATDLSAGNCTGSGEGNCSVAWSVERTTEQAYQGAASVRMSLDNLNDQGKIWIERSFDAPPGRAVRVRVAFALASADFGSVNHWTIIAGALPARAASSGDLTSAFRGDTGNGWAGPSGYVWLQKTYDSTVQVSADGPLWVVIGVWGTWETARTYYVDAVRVDLTVL